MNDDYGDGNHDDDDDNDDDDDDNDDALIYLYNGNNKTVQAWLMCRYRE